MQVEFRATTCPICGPDAPADEVYPAALTNQTFTSAVFSARRTPDGLHYRFVRCTRCGLLRSDPIATAATVESLYRESSFDYSEEVPNLQRTYGRYLDVALRFGGPRGKFLEIGCGDGFFLSEAKRRGFEIVRGVDPGGANQPASSDGAAIVREPFRAGLFAPASFDVICAFQVLDHLEDPLHTLRLCHEILAPGGVMLLIHHDANALSARVLGRRSPIIDVQHTFLYTQQTTRKLMEKAGFATMYLDSATNDVSLRHLMHLAPVHPRIKDRVLKGFRMVRLANLSLRLPLGNLVAIGRRPAP